jgi:hypothetical protein
MAYQWYKTDSRQSPGDAYPYYPEGYAVDADTGSITSPTGIPVSGANSDTFNPAYWDIGYDSSLLPPEEQPDQPFDTSWYYYCEIWAIFIPEDGNGYTSEIVYSKAAKAQVRESSNNSGGAVMSRFDLTGVIPMPTDGDEASSSSSYSGQYTVGLITWRDISGNPITPVNPVSTFIMNHSYTASFTLAAAEGYSFNDLSNGTWTAGTGSSTTNFYHTGAATVVQNNNTGLTIDITVTFLPVLNYITGENLNSIIPTPVWGSAPVLLSSYSGDYTVAGIIWTDISENPVTPVNPVSVFLAGHTYTVGFTLTAAANHSFDRLSSGIWTTGTAPSTTNFYHTGATSVVQTKSSSSTMGISITFIPSTAPSGTGEITAINAAATAINFTLTSSNTGTWKVYDTETGGNDITVLVHASFNAATKTLTLASQSAISPKTYYVSVTEQGKLESGRLALWRTLNSGADAMSLASRFNIPESALPAGTDGVCALFNVLHLYLADIRPQVMLAPYTVPGVVLGDWIDLPSLIVDAYGNYSEHGSNWSAEDWPDEDKGRINITSNTDLGTHGTLLRLIVVGNNSFHSGKDAYTETANDDTPHLVFQFQNLPGRHRMDIPSHYVNYLFNGTTTSEIDCWEYGWVCVAEKGYSGAEMREYLSPVAGVAGSGAFLAGLVAAGVPDNLFFAPTRHVSGPRGAVGNSIVTIQDKVWLPTEYEMCRSTEWSVQETAERQAHLEYYTTDTRRTKYTGANTAGAWWRGSPNIDNNVFAQYSDASLPEPIFFRATGEGGAGGSKDASKAWWVAPAFCVW